MRDSIRYEILRWYTLRYHAMKNYRIADLGSYYINGSTKEVLHGIHDCSAIIGFDIMHGPNVDVCIDNAGIIPEEHQQKYDAVVATHSFQFCGIGNTDKFKNEVIQLLKPGGLFFFSICNPECDIKHSTSVNNGSEIRMTEAELVEFWDDEFIVEDIHRTGEDIIMLARKK